jgi:plasmid stabilization system protein ParE
MTAYKLIFTPEAREDVTGAAVYYNSQLRGLGKIFKNEVKRQLLLLKQNPLLRTVRYDNVRFAVLNKFPYSIHYTVNNNDTIMIHAVVCNFRDPMEFWLPR